MSSPFKFLDAYTKEDKAIFFGRDNEIEELYQKVFGNKLLIICGISGTGKTSLINCGLANKFEESDWLPINIRRDNDIISSLRTGISKMAITPLQDNQTIVSKLKSLYLDHFKPVYLIFDQFEEIFIFGNREERKEFISEVKKIIDSDIQCRLLFVMREEYLAGAIEFEREIPAFLTNRIRIEKMTWHNARKVIEEPCKVYGIAVEEGLSEKILQKLSPETTEVELTYLQVLLDKMYRLAIEKNKENPMFSNHLLAELGDVTDLLESFLDTQISQLEDPELGMTVLKAFVSVKGTKRQITEKEIIEFSHTIGKNVETEKLTVLVQKFVNLRILRDKDENGRYELRHDSLAAIIYEKITLVEKELIEVRQFIENAYDTYEKRKILLSDNDLKYLMVYEDKLFLNDKLKEFVGLSKKNIHAKRKQFNSILRVSLIGCVLFLVGVVYYYYQSTSEKKNIERVVKSLVQSEVLPEVSFKSAVETYRMDSTSSLAHFAVLNSFYRLLDGKRYYDSLNKVYYDPYSLIFDFKSCQANILCARFSQDGKFIYGWLDDNTVKVWDIHGKELTGMPGNEHVIITVSLSMNNEFIVIVYADSTGIVYDINGEKIFDFPVMINPVFNNKVVDLSQDNRFLAVAGLYNNIDLYELNGSLFQLIKGHSGRINYLSFSPDSRFISSASDDKTVMVWNFNKKDGLFGPYDTIRGHSGAVRSCNFSHNSKYILTAADDSMVAVWNLNGSLVYDYRLYNYTWMDFPQDKICNAVFTSNEEMIRITRYRLNTSDSAGGFLYSQTLLAEDGHYFEYMFPSRNRMVFTDYNENFDQFKEVRYLDYNSRDHTISIQPINIKQVILISPDLMPMKYFDGSSPVFSETGDYLLYINNNELRLYPVSAPELIKLVLEQKIFGEIDNKQGDWVHRF